MALVISLGRLYASPPANHTQAIVVAEYTRAMVQATACLKMLNPQNPESQGISPAFLVAAKSAFAQLEKLRLRDSVDGIWVVLSKETDVQLTKMTTNTSSFGEAMLGIDIAMQYQAHEGKPLLFVPHPFVRDSVSSHGRPRVGVRRQKRLLPTHCNLRMSDSTAK
jgi:hypothetical protein